MTAREVLDQHYASLSEEAAEIILERVTDMGNFFDSADLAVRTCECGFLIDGFYSYTEHLMEKLKEAGF